MVDFTQFRHIERLQHTQWIAERDDHLPGGVVLKSEVLAAFPYKGIEEPKLEFDDHDSASITFSARAPATSKTCPIHLDDFSVTLSAPGFIGSPLLRQSIRVKDFCVLSWQTQVAPLHGGLQGIEVGVHFSPKWLRDPQDRIMPMTIHILEPRAWEENALLTSIIAAVITTVLSFAFSRVK